MKTEVPEEIKATLPRTLWGKILGMTPVVMAVVATLFAGLASSEMTKAQYDRSLAAQQQSKAGDQWGLFQAKRLRGSIQSGTLDLVQLIPGGRPMDGAALHTLAAKLPQAEQSQKALELLLSGRLPQAASPPPLPAKVKTALEAIERGLLEPALHSAVEAPSPDDVKSALRGSEQYARDFDALLKPVVGGGDALGDLLEPGGTGRPELVRDFTTLRLRYSALRYDTEARLNQGIAALLELQVAQSNYSAERHRRRSERFFFAMLGAQASVIIATLAMAAQQRNLLWSLAALAGVLGVLFAASVFVFL